jgi:hypothetical protein
MSKALIRICFFGFSPFDATEVPVGVTSCDEAIVKWLRV